ncbi:uncharacterized protein [Bemisia tabaci]|uniref:uncharacterized protein n=1 Tax=Bemisia tabaci TaxID=7038 RepID=UPI003B284458
MRLNDQAQSGATLKLKGNARVRVHKGKPNHGSTNLIISNVNRSEYSRLLIEQTAAEQSALLVCLLEPNEFFGRRYRSAGGATDKSEICPDVLIRGPITTPKNVTNGCILTKIEDTYVFLCYFPPSLSDHEFQGKLDKIMEEIMTSKLSNYVIAGDLNGRSEKWGDKTSNKRGDMLLEWILMLGLCILNEGSTPTFIGGRGDSIPDVAFASPTAACAVKWERMDEYVSDHASMLLRFVQRDNKKEKQKTQEDLTPYQRVKLTRTQLEELEKVIARDQCKLRTALAPLEDSSIEEWVNTVTRFTLDCMSEIAPVNKAGKARNLSWKPKIWWNDTIAGLRKTSGQLRRKLTAARRRVNPDPAEVDLIWREYVSTTGKLNTEIRLAKKEAWK